MRDTVSAAPARNFIRSLPTRPDRNDQNMINFINKLADGR